MALYHLTTRIGSRARGQSARVHFDYDARQGKFKKHPDRALFSETKNLPGWASSPREFWSGVDAHERANARLWREVEFALPVELPEPQQIELAREFCAWVARPAGGEGALTYTMAVHSGGGRNPHCHLMIAGRADDAIPRDEVTWFKRANKGAPEKGGAAKTRRDMPKTWLQELREEWARAANDALAEAGQAARIDHRSYAVRGRSEVPGTHLGPARHRALRQRQQGKAPAEILGQDQALERALQVRRARSIATEIEALERELATTQLAPEGPVQITITNPNHGGNQRMINQTNRPNPATQMHQRKQAEREKWNRLDQRRRDQLEQDEALAKSRRDQQAADDQRSARERQAEQEQREIEQQLGIHQSADATILAGASSDQIEQAGSRAVRPIEFALAGYVARKIVTTRGYEAVAYTRTGESRPHLIDYGNEVRAYGAASPEEHRERARAMIELGRSKGWQSMRFWGSEKWLKASYIEARKADVPWMVDESRSDFVPDATTLEAWAQEAEAKDAEQGASVAEDAIATSEKAAKESGEQPVEEQAKGEDPYAGWTRAQMLSRLLELRRKHSLEFADDDDPDEQGQGGPRLG